MIDRETVQNVAKLARLGLSEEEVTTFGGQLSAILGAYRYFTRGRRQRRLPHRARFPPHEHYA